MNSPPSTPWRTTAETNQIVQDCTHDLLTDTNLTTMQNEGELVDHWEMLAPDHWRFVLKDNVTFHDGTILNVDDVEFTFQRSRGKIHHRKLHGQNFRVHQGG